MDPKPLKSIWDLVKIFYTDDPFCAKFIKIVDNFELKSQNRAFPGVSNWYNSCIKAKV